MTEVRTQPVAATYEPRLEERSWEEDGIASLAPGSFCFSKQGHYGKPELGEWDVMWYKCPCGCNRIGCLSVGNGFKPEHGHVGRATWHWNGDREKPTLTPSIHHVGHWHGFLTDGVWRSV